MKQKTKEIRDKPDITINAAEAFDIDFDMEVPAYSEPDEYVPKIIPIINAIENGFNTSPP